MAPQKLSPRSKRGNEDRNPAPTNAQDQILLKALQDIIVRVVDPNRTNNISQLPFGPEADKLVTALREFVISIAGRSESMAQTTIIKVSLAEEDDALEGNNDEDDKGASLPILISSAKLPGNEIKDDDLHRLDYLQNSPPSFQDKLLKGLRKHVFNVIPIRESSTHTGIAEHSETSIAIKQKEEDNPLQGSDDEHGKEVSLPTTSSAKSPARNEVRNVDLQQLDSSKNLQTIFQDKLLKRLREHVFNTMPIRMLSFEPHESSLQITLLERGVIHQRLESALRAKMHESDHIPIFSADWDIMETEDEAIERLITQYAQYAILSHTWLRMSGEVTYSDWNKTVPDTEHPGYHKLVNFCKVAWKDYGLTLGWMDTVCINKESSSELDESIRSMYSWYSRAAVCITYLAETENLSVMDVDPWFSRGWTLQELLAPDVIKFYNNHWKPLVEDSDNDKYDTIIKKQIKRATTISEDELDSIRCASISRRMQLAATREVTREEDTAYSLMGIFGVSISTAYGEGAQRAFFRLLKEILVASRNVLDVLNWADELPDARPHASRILPSSPLHYLNSYQSHVNDLSALRPLEPLILTHLGLRVPVILMPALTIRHKESQYIPVGNYNAIVNISPVRRWRRAPTATYYLLDSRISGRDGLKADNEYQVTLAVFNISGGPESILINKSCIAKVLLCNEGTGEVTSLGNFSAIDTDVPTVFDLTCAGAAHDITYDVRRVALKGHGMQLVSLYL